MQWLEGSARLAPEDAVDRAGAHAACQSATCKAAVSALEVAAHAGPALAQKAMARTVSLVRKRRDISVVASHAVQ